MMLIGKILKCGNGGGVAASVHTVPQCCASEIIFSGSGSYLDLNFGSGFEFGSGSGLFMKNTLEIQMI